MVRVIYLLAQGADRRSLLIEASVNGETWAKEGCAFIHLSNLHDYNDRDPLARLPGQERSDILTHCRHYHGGPESEEAGFEDLVEYVPRVLEKIAANLECYLKELEAGVVRSATEL